MTDNQALKNIGYVIVIMVAVAVGILGLANGIAGSVKGESATVETVVGE